MLERGFVVTATRIFKRLWQLYVTYVVLFVVYIDLIGYVAQKSRASELIGEFNVTGIVDHTIRTLIYGLLLQAKPLNLDVLQLFIVLMAFFPLVLLGMMRRPNLTMAASASLYFAARLLDWNLSSFPDGRWYLNPFCWQLLLVLGTWFASIGARQKHAISALQDFRILRVAAWLYLIFALVVTIAGKFPRIAGIVPEYLLDAFLLPTTGRTSRLAESPPFSRVGISLHLHGAAGLAWIPMASVAAGHQVRRGMAIGLLRRRVPFVRRSSRPDHRTGFACHACPGQRQRDCDHDERCLLRVLVQTAGPQARTASSTNAWTSGGRPAHKVNSRRLPPRPCLR